MKDSVFYFEKSDLERAAQRAEEAARQYEIQIEAAQRKAEEAESQCEYHQRKAEEAERQYEIQIETAQRKAEEAERQCELQLRKAARQIDKKQEENVKLYTENDKLRRRNDELEMKLAEMGKLSARVAQNTSEDNLLKALRTYTNQSKRKKPETRVTAKKMVLDFAAANNLSLPSELEAALDNLDNEVPQVHVTVHGNFNDIHDNKEVKIK